MNRTNAVSLVMLLLCLYGGVVLAATPGGAGNNAAIVTDSIDQGGQQIIFGTNQIDNSIGGIVGTSSGGTFTMLHGYIAQLGNPVGPDSISAFTATPNPALVAQVVTFSVMTDPDLTIAYDFGDGSTDNSNQSTVMHAYSTAGTFTATCTVSNGDGESVSKSIDVLVFNPNAFDSDGDGVSNSLEVLLGSDPFNFNSTPLGVVPGTQQTLTISRITVTLNFAVANKDQITLQGRIVIPIGFTPLNSIVALDVGG